jgi:hypothetical protein
MHVIHRKDAMNAKIRVCLAEVTEGAEGMILFACPEEFSGQAKRLFWRIGLSPILQNKHPLFASSAPRTSYAFAGRVGGKREF